MSQEMRLRMMLAGLGQMPNVVRWDPELLEQPDHPVLFQRGCPAGYFSEFVAPGTAGAQPYPLLMVTGNPADTQLAQGTWVRCRLVATTTPETLIRETGLSIAEATSVYSGAIADTIQQIPQRVQAVVAAAASVGQWLIVGLVAVAAILLLRK